MVPWFLLDDVRLLVTSRVLVRSWRSRSSEWHQAPVLSWFAPSLTVHGSFVFFDGTSTTNSKNRDNRQHDEVQTNDVTRSDLWRHLFLLRDHFDGGDVYETKHTDPRRVPGTAVTSASSKHVTSNAEIGNALSLGTFLVSYTLQIVYSAGACSFNSQSDNTISRSQR